MTAITAIISKQCTVHASDSFITIAKGDDVFEVMETQKTKIVRVPCHRGAMAYWGLAECEYYAWSTIAWLQQQANQADHFTSPEGFAIALTDRLNQEISRMKFSDPLTNGIGIHFTTYENVDGYWIPELFAITNYATTAYDSLHSDGVRCSRQTFNSLFNIPSQPDHRDRTYRLFVHQILLSKNALLVYNNGDPLVFNPVANAILQSIGVIASRGELRDPNSVEIYRNVAKSAIDIVCQIQEKFVQEEKKAVGGEQRRFVLRGNRRIGGQRHALAITPQGDYLPVSGD